MQTPEFLREAGRAARLSGRCSPQRYNHQVPQRLLWLLPQPCKSSAASLPASPYRGAEGLGHAGGPGQLSGPSHRKRNRRADRKWGRAARPSGSICAPGHNGRALPLGSMDLSVGRLHAVSLKSRFGGLRPVALPGPLRRKRGGRRAIRFAPAVGCGLSAGSQEARSTRVTVVVRSALGRST